jgi:hypothetical protein
MTTTYSATLTNLRGVTADERQAATERFCEALEAALGGEGKVAQAYADYMRVFTHYGESPLPAGSSFLDCAIIDRWEEAERAGHQAAFAGWSNIGGAHFEIEI